MGAQKPLDPALVRDCCQNYWEWLSSLFRFTTKIAYVQRQETALRAPKLVVPEEEIAVLKRRLVSRALPGSDLTIDAERVTSGSLYVQEDEVTEEEVADARTQIRKIAQQLITTLSRTRKHSKVKKQIDFRRTLRRSIQMGGVLVDLKFKERIIKKPRLVIILDTSGSMQIWIKMLIQLIQAVGLELSKKEVFIFAQDLECITKDLRKTWQETIKVVQLRENWGGTTSIYYALKTLQEEHHEKLSPQTVVLMLSDLFTAEPVKSSEEAKKICRKTKGFYIFRTVDEDDVVFYETYVRPFVGSVTAVYDVHDVKTMAEAVRRVCLK